MGNLVLVWFVFSMSGVAQFQEEQEAEADLPMKPEESSPPQVPEPKSKLLQPPECLDKEPDVQEVVRVAWEEAGLLRDDDLSRAKRVRASGWLPRIAGGVSKDMDDARDYRYEPGSPRVDQFHQDTGFDWDVGLSWDMSEAVFQNEELQVAREASRRSRERLDLAHEVIRLYFSRKRLLLQAVSSSKSDVELRLAETTSTLDAWTDSRFRHLWCREKESLR